MCLFKSVIDNVHFTRHFVLVYISFIECRYSITIMISTALHAKDRLDRVKYLILFSCLIGFIGCWKLLFTLRWSMLTLAWISASYIIIYSVCISSCLCSKNAHVRNIYYRWCCGEVLRFKSFGLELELWLALRRETTSRDMDEEVV